MEGKSRGSWPDLYTYETDLQQADIYLMTFRWPYYVTHQKIQIAQEEVARAKLINKPIVIFSDGDYPSNLPFEDVILFESAGYCSTPGLHYHNAQPTFIADDVKVYCHGDLQLRDKREESMVGFYGLASTSRLQRLFRSLKLKKQQFKYQKGYLKWEPPPFETSAFRSKVLRQFENQSGIQTNFILRKRYCAGVTDDKSTHHPAKVEFVNNNLNSDYTICMRGSVNFSLRFYETLCLGRIPIFIDTDCLLPFQDEIDDKSYFSWINIKDPPHAPEIFRDFHNKLSNKAFTNLQKACRQLCVEQIPPDVFHHGFVKKMRGFL